MLGSLADHFSTCWHFKTAVILFWQTSRNVNVCLHNIFALIFSFPSFFSLRQLKIFMNNQNCNNSQRWWNEKSFVKTTSRDPPFTIHLLLLLRCHIMVDVKNQRGRGEKNCEKFYNCTWWRICEKWYLRESIFMLMFRRHNVGFNECLSLYISQIVKANIVQAWRWKILKELNASIKLLCVLYSCWPRTNFDFKGVRENLFMMCC